MLLSTVLRLHLLWSRGIGILMFGLFCCPRKCTPGLRPPASLATAASISRRTFFCNAKGVSPS